MMRLFTAARRILSGGILLLVIGAPRVGLAEVVVSPLGEMRIAAEAVGDVDPEPERASARVTLRAAVRSAVHDEIQRELHRAGSGGGAPSPGARRARDEAKGESERSTAGRASEVAAEAQLARLNREVSQGRGRMQPRPVTGVPQAPSLRR